MEYEGRLMGTIQTVWGSGPMMHYGGGVSIDIGKVSYVTPNIDSLDGTETPE